MVDRDQANRSETPFGGSSSGSFGTGATPPSGAAGVGGTSSAPGGRADAATQGMGERAQQQAAQVKDQVQQKAGEVKDQVAGQAANQLENQKEQATGGIGSMAQAFRQTGRHLREQDQGAVAGYADRAAEQIEHVAGYLRERDMRDLAGDVERFARREPALFLGGAFALGLFAARFLKSSGQPAQSGQSGQYAGTMPASVTPRTAPPPTTPASSGVRATTVTGAPQSHRPLAGVATPPASTTATTGGSAFTGATPRPAPPASAADDATSRSERRGLPDQEGRVTTPESWRRGDASS